MAILSDIFVAAPSEGRIGTVAMTPIYQSLGTKEEKRA
jgi:hypothetical protein